MNARGKKRGKRKKRKEMHVVAERGNNRPPVPRYWILHQVGTLLNDQLITNHKKVFRLYTHTCIICVFIDIEHITYKLYV